MIEESEWKRLEVEQNWSIWKIYLPAMSVDTKEEADRYVALITKRLIKEKGHTAESAHEFLSEELPSLASMNSDNMRRFWSDYFDGNTPVSLNVIETKVIDGIEYVKLSDVKCAIEKYCNK